MKGLRFRARRAAADETAAAGMPQEAGASVAAPTPLADELRARWAQLTAENARLRELVDLQRCPLGLHACISSPGAAPGAQGGVPRPASAAREG